MYAEGQHSDSLRGTVGLAHCSEPSSHNKIPCEIELIVNGFDSYIISSNICAQMSPPETYHLITCKHAWENAKAVSNLLYYLYKETNILLNMQMVDGFLSLCYATYIFTNICICTVIKYN